MQVLRKSPICQPSCLCSTCRDLDVAVLLADELVATVADFVQYAFSAPLPHEPLLQGRFGISSLIVVVNAPCASTGVHY